MSQQNEMRWAIVTRMPSTGALVNWSEHTGTREEFLACCERWADADAVRVSEISGSQEEE